MTTPNFGWPLIQPTDLVTDLPADFEAFADAVDADLDGLNGGTIGQVLTKASATDYDFAFATLPALPITTEGDLIVGDATGVPIRLPVGAAGQVLTSDGDTVAFAAPAAAGDNFILLNAGGTSLSGNASVTISGISNANKLFIRVFNTGTSNDAVNIFIRLNADSGSKYFPGGNQIFGQSTFNQGNFRGIGDTATGIFLGGSGLSFNSGFQASVVVSGCNSSGSKLFQSVGGGNNQNHVLCSQQGVFSDSATISSVQIIPSSGTFNNGTIFVFASS